MPLRITRSSPVPSSSVNFRSFFDFLTASQALTFTARKSLLEKVSKSTKSWNSGSICTLEKSIFSSAAGAAGAASAGLASGVSGFLSESKGFIVGNRITSRMELAPHSSMAQRSMPKPRPPVGGMPYSSAMTKSSSIMLASSSPWARFSACALKRWYWSMGSLSSEKALPISQPQMNIS